MERGRLRSQEAADWKKPSKQEVQDRNPDKFPKSNDGKYECIQKLGEGVFGRAFRAERIHRNKEGKEIMRDPVIIKALKTEKLGDDKGRSRERFVREFQALSKVSNNEHIATLIDVTTLESGEIGVVMKDVGEGVKELEQLIGEGMSEEEVSEIAIQLCLALHDLHKNGFIHRDIKPENVLVSDEGGWRHVNLIDLGLAGLVAEEQERKVSRNSDEYLDFYETDEYVNPALTVEGGILGTLPYMDPEMMAEGKATKSSDLHSLGVMLYEMRTGKLPFKDKDETGKPLEARAYALKKMFSDPVPIHEALGKSEPNLFDKIIMQLLEKESEERSFLNVDGQKVLLDTPHHVAQTLKHAMLAEKPELYARYPYTLV